LTTLADLLSILTLEPIEVNMFRGMTPEDERGHNRIFGGQVIAQALMAAYRTVEERHCHSLQAYFIRPGDPKIPVLYQVERSRDGKSFATRRVIAIQHGEQILNLAASFQVAETGFEHADPMPAAPDPETVPTEIQRAVEAGERWPEPFREAIMRERSIDILRVDPVDPVAPQPAPPKQQVWFRAAGPVPSDVAMNQAIIAYASDMSLLSTCARPHGHTWMTGLQMASLDHAMWFHRPSDLTSWHLYDQESPSASGARGFNRGAIYAANGTLVASVAQEGLIRQRS
jgi:acyl-CoA thioesterase II